MVLKNKKMATKDQKKNKNKDGWEIVIGDNYDDILDKIIEFKCLTRIDAAEDWAEKAMNTESRITNDYISIYENYILSMCRDELYVTVLPENWRSFGVIKNWDVKKYQIVLSDTNTNIGINVIKFLNTKNKLYLMISSDDDKVSITDVKLKIIKLKDNITNFHTVHYYNPNDLDDFDINKIFEIRYIINIDGCNSLHVDNIDNLWLLQSYHGMFPTSTLYKIKNIDNKIIKIDEDDILHIPEILNIKQLIGFDNNNQHIISTGFDATMAIIENLDVKFIDVIQESNIMKMNDVNLYEKINYVKFGNKIIMTINNSKGSSSRMEIFDYESKKLLNEINLNFYIDNIYFNDDAIHITSENNIYICYSKSLFNLFVQLKNSHTYLSIIPKDIANIIHLYTF